MKNSIGSLLVVIVLATTTLAFELKCDFKTNTNWWAINDVYFCDLNDDIDGSKSKNDVVTAVTGCHSGENSNRNVVGFRAENKKLHYFPKGLGKHFKEEKIEFIAVWSTGLKEIHKSDLSPFYNMRILSLWDNDFEVIESDLFKYNPQIEYIGLGKNKIKFIDGNVFGHLSKLHTLHIDGNSCISRQAVGDRRGVLELIDEIKEKCTVPASEFKLDVRFDTTQK